MNPTYKQVTKTRYFSTVSALAEDIFPEHYHRMTLKVAKALAEAYQSPDVTDDEVHAGSNYFLVYLGSEPVGYFALDLRTAGAVCISRLFLLQKARGRGIGRDIVAYAEKLAAGDNRSRLYLTAWAKDLQLEAFCKKRGFRPAGAAPKEVLPGVTLELKTWEKLWR